MRIYINTQRGDKVYALKITFFQINHKAVYFKTETTPIASNKLRDSIKKKR